MKSYGEYIPIRSFPPRRMQAYDCTGNLDGDVRILVGLALAKLRGGNTTHLLPTLPLVSTALHRGFHPLCASRGRRGPLKVKALIGIVYAVNFSRSICVFIGPHKAVNGYLIMKF